MLNSPVKDVFVLRFSLAENNGLNHLLSFIQFTIHVQVKPFAIISRLLICIFLGLTTACVFTGPPNNSNFKSINVLSDVEGTYRNRGETDNGGFAVYLSKMIWPNDEKLEHNRIDNINIRQVDNTKIEVKAYRYKTCVKQEIFKLGADFNIDGGLVTIKREIGLSGWKSGDPMFGLYYESLYLGIDESGNGKSRKREAAAGLLFLTIPMALGQISDVRFERIPE